MVEKNCLEDTVLHFPPVLNLAAAEELKEKFTHSLVAHSSLVCNASDVTNLTTPCLQVIISAGKTMEKNGDTFTILSPSTPFIQAFDDLGLMDIYQKWSDK
ncbi:STAS domain-containing protein [Sneathiella aquimaris]|uniref:STAS domain-containing protein n=1 Tax=Sneathiella aquimaris TaxID=2599305 RepID=UPI00146CE4F1|nr:STAS domain-containing protein [Sneathiella aquimaris]